MKTPAASRLSRKMTLGALALVVSASGAAALFAGGCHHGEPKTATSASRSGEGAGSAAAANATSKGARGRAEAPGLLHVYSVRFNQALAFNSADDRNANAAIKLDVGASLALAFVGNDGDRHRLYGQLSDVKVDVGGAKPEQTAALVQELQKPFYVSADADGRVRGYAFARDLSTMAQNMIRGLVGSSQVAARGDATFVAAEDDIHGTYQATYSREASGEIRKTKGRYDRVATLSSLVRANDSATVETGGQTIAKLDESGWVTTLSVDEKKKATMGEKMPTASTQIRLDMKLESTRLDASLIARFEQDRADLVIVGPYGTGDEAAATRSSDQKLVGERSVDDLASLVRRATDDQERGRLSEQLSARFRLTPGSVDRAVELASKLPPRDGQLVASALASAETPESMRALGSLANAKQAPSVVRAQAATQLAFAGKHSGEARDSLLQAMGDGSRDVRESAALALGNVARELDGEPTAVNELVQSYREATTDEDRVVFMRALGNSGSPELLPIAREALANPNESLREAAAAALRFLPLGEADVLLDATLVADDSENVRESAVDAIGFRIVEKHAATLARSLDTDGSGKVKAEIGTIITRALAVRGGTLSQEARAVLKALLAKLPPPRQ